MGKPEDDTEDIQPRPGEWAFMPYTDEQDQGFNRFREAFFKNLVEAAKPFSGEWTLDLQGTRLTYHIPESPDRGKAIDLHLLFSPTFNALYLQVEPFEVKKRPKPKGWSSVEEYLRKHHDPERIRVRMAPGKTKQTCAVDLSIVVEQPGARKFPQLLMGTMQLLSMLVDRARYIRAALT